MNQELCDPMEQELPRTTVDRLLKEAERKSLDRSLEEAKKNGVAFDLCNSDTEIPFPKVKAERRKYRGSRFPVGEPDPNVRPSIF